MTGSDNAVPYPSERALTTAETAAMCGVSQRSLIVWRSVGGGPVFVKLGRRVAYLPEDIRAWLAERRRTSTSDPGPTPKEQPPERRSAPPPRTPTRKRRVRA